MQLWTNIFNYKITSSRYIYMIAIYFPDFISSIEKIKRWENWIFHGIFDDFFQQRNSIAYWGFWDKIGTHRRFHLVPEWNKMHRCNSSKISPETDCLQDGRGSQAPVTRQSRCFCRQTNRRSASQRYIVNGDPLSRLPHLYVHNVAGRIPAYNSFGRRPPTIE